MGKLIQFHTETFATFNGFSSLCACYRILNSGSRMQLLISEISLCCVIYQSVLDSEKSILITRYCRCDCYHQWYLRKHNGSLFSGLLTIYNLLVGQLGLAILNALSFLWILQLIAQTLLCHHIVVHGRSQQRSLYCLPRPCSKLGTGKLMFWVRDVHGF